MTLSNPRSPMPRKRPPPRIVEVRRVMQLTPHMIRVTLSGRELEGFATKGVAEHIRVYLPDPQTGALPMPVLGPEGNAFPEGQPRPTSRAYTPRRWDPGSNELDVDFVIHDEGPASKWATSVKQGDTAVISGQPGGPYIPDPTVDWYLIGGDEAALPAIGTLLEVLPTSVEAHVLVEVSGPAEEQHFQTSSRLHLTWLHRPSTETLPGRNLASALRRVELPPGEGRIWVACEASVMREIRRHLLEERGLERSALHTQGYWKSGDVNHPDHDMGDDV